MSNTEVNLVKAYWTATSIDMNGANAAATNLAKVGNVSGYSYIANQAATTGQTIIVQTDHSWNITGTTAADVIWGGAGSDTFTGQEVSGNDTVYGGAGKNVYDYTATTVANIVSLADYDYAKDISFDDTCNTIFMIMQKIMLK